MSGGSQKYKYFAGFLFVVLLLHAISYWYLLCDNPPELHTSGPPLPNEVPPLPNEVHRLHLGSSSSEWVFNYTYPAELIVSHNGHSTLNIQNYHEDGHIIVCNLNASEPLWVTFPGHSIRFLEFHRGYINVSRHPIRSGTCLELLGLTHAVTCNFLKGDLSEPRAVRKPVPQEMDDRLIAATDLEDFWRLEEEHVLVGNCTVPENTEVIVLSLHFSRIEFLELQFATSKVFLSSNTLVVYFIDAYPLDLEKYQRVQMVHMGRKNVRQSLLRRCQSLGICCVPIPTSIHSPCSYTSEHGIPYETSITTNQHEPSIRTGAGLQFALDHFGFPFKGKVVVMDGDMVFLKPVDFSLFLEEGRALAAVRQSRSEDEVTIEYLYNGLVVVDNEKLPDRYELEWCCGRQENLPVDTGGCTRQWMLAHSPELIQFIPQGKHSVRAFGSRLEIGHYLGGGVWDEENDIVHNNRFNSFYCNVRKEIQIHSNSELLNFERISQLVMVNIPANFTFEC